MMTSRERGRWDSRVSERFFHACAAVTSRRREGGAIALFGGRDRSGGMADNEVSLKKRKKKLEKEKKENGEEEDHHHHRLLDILASYSSSVQTPRGGMGRSGGRRQTMASPICGYSCLRVYPYRKTMPCLSVSVCLVEGLGLKCGHSRVSVRPVSDLSTRSSRLSMRGLSVCVDAELWVLCRRSIPTQKNDRSWLNRR